MQAKSVPYERIGHVSVGLVTLLFIIHKLSPTFHPGVIAGVMGVAVAVIVACVGLELYVRIGQYRAGNLYLIRNATFYTGILILLIVFNHLFNLISLLFVSNNYAGSLNLITSLFYVGFGLGFTTLTFSFFYLDSVMLEHRNGALRTVMPLFSIGEASVQDDEVLISSQEGRNVLLRQSQFSRASWSDLCTRVSALVD